MMRGWHSCCIRAVTHAAMRAGDGLIIRGARVRLLPGPCGFAVFPLHAACDVRRGLQAVASLLRDLDVASEVA